MRFFLKVKLFLKYQRWEVLTGIDQEQSCKKLQLFSCVGSGKLEPMKTTQYICKTVKTDKEAEKYLNDLVYLHECSLIDVQAFPIGNSILLIALVRVTIQSLDPLADKAAQTA